MKSIFLIFCVIIPLSLSISGENQTADWSSGTAYLLPKGRMETGVFLPLRYGYSESMEFSMHPLAAFIIPNLNMKWQHSVWQRYAISTRHSFVYPTLLLRTISREGTGGIISPEFHIPHMVSLYNEALVSKQLFQEHVITAKAGFSVAWRSGYLDDRTTIDLPIVYHRLLVFYHDLGLRAGFDLQGKLVKKWGYSIDTDFFITPSAEDGFCYEHQGLIIWKKNRNFQIYFGYKLVYAEYPFGTQWHLLGPLFDLQWAWHR